MSQATAAEDLASWSQYQHYRREPMSPNNLCWRNLVSATFFFYSLFCPLHPHVIWETGSCLQSLTYKVVHMFCALYASSQTHFLVKTLVLIDKILMYTDMGQNVWHFKVDLCITHCSVNTSQIDLPVSNVINNNQTAINIHKKRKLLSSL